MINQIFRFDFLLPALSVIAALLMRPSFLGEVYSNVGYSIAIITCLVFVLTKGKIKFNQHNLLQLALITCTCIYLLMHTILVENPNIHIASKTILGYFIGFLSIAIVLSNERYLNFFFDCFFYILCFFSLSYIVTIILILSVGLERVIWTSIDYNYFLEMSIFYPSTPIYGVMHSGSFAAPRLAAFAREAGIAQAFFIWGFWWGYFREKKKVFLILMILGTIFTFSTAGIFIFILVAMIFFLFKKHKRKNLILLLPTFFTVVFVGFYAFVYAPVIGLAEKEKTHSGSVEYRSSALFDSFDHVMEYPLGVGVNNGMFGRGAGVNLLAASQLIGLFGTILVLLQFLLPKIIYFKPDRFILMIPFLLTVLLFQPIYDTPLIAIFLLSLSSKP